MAIRKRFYKWLREWAERKEREVINERRYSSQCCPHCKTWDSNMPDNCWADFKANTPTMQHDQLKCGKCGQWTTWLDVGILRILDDPAFPENRPKCVDGKPTYDKGNTA